VRQLEQLGFSDAAVRLGATPEPEIAHRERTARIRQPSTSVDDPFRGVVLEAAMELYHNTLMNNRIALAYLAARGFDRNLAERWRLGYAAHAELAPYLKWRGLPVASARWAGLLDAHGRDRLANRIVIPEFRAGKPVWLIGRVLESKDNDCKYRGLPGTKPLLGWDEATRDLRAVILVEGPFDLLAMRKWGAPAMALCGTSVSPARLEELDRWARLYTVLDRDSAGREATRALIQAFGARVLPVELPAGVKDPADLARDPWGDVLVAAAIYRAAGVSDDSRSASAARESHG